MSNKELICRTYKKQSYKSIRKRQPDTEGGTRKEDMSIKRKKKGQQTLEDILILTVISEMQIKIRHLFDFFSSDWQQKKN